jgi:hypothetical protein
MIDTLGRDIMVKREFSEDPATGWPVHTQALSVRQGEVLVLTGGDVNDPEVQEVVRRLSRRSRQPAYMVASAVNLPFAAIWGESRCPVSAGGGRAGGG